MKSIVIVSHSKKFAEGAAELIKMSNNDITVVAAGGLEDGSLGTSYEKIKSAILSVYSNEGVLIIPDLGSSIMTSEMVIEELALGGKTNIEISSMHLAENLVELSLNLNKINAIDGEEIASFEFVINNPVGLHARPAAELVKFVQTLNCDVSITFNGKNASCLSLISILSLGVVSGSTVTFTLKGNDINTKEKLLIEFIKKNL